MAARYASHKEGKQERVYRQNEPTGTTNEKAEWEYKIWMVKKIY